MELNIYYLCYHERTLQVLEVLNSYLLGVYTSEANALKGILQSIEEDDEDDVNDINKLLDYKVGNDFKVYRVPANFNLELVAYPNDSEGTDYSRAGEDVTPNTYNDLLIRKRELNIDEIVE